MLTGTWEETFLILPRHSDLGLHHIPLSPTDLDRKNMVHIQEEIQQRKCVTKICEDITIGLGLGGARNDKVRAEKKKKGLGKN